MSLPSDSKKRQVLPRWLPFEQFSLIHNELIHNTLEVRAPSDIDRENHFYNEKLNSWLKTPDEMSAIDFLETSKFLGLKDENTELAAKALIVGSSGNSNSVRKLALGFLDKLQPKLEVISDNIDYLRKSRAAISGLKRKLIATPKNSIYWIDLAYHYTVAGHTEKARRSIDVALNLNSNNRFVLAGSVRYFLHQDEPDFALSILRNSESLKFDPFLISAEIAISESIERTSKNIRIGRGLLKNIDLNLFGATELSSTLGTLEASHGSSKNAKKFIRDSLISPNENTIAQALWLNHKEGFVIPVNTNSINSFEAKTRENYLNGDLKGVVNEATKWFYYQPFSSIPVVDASYMSSLALEDYENTVDLCTKALLTLSLEPMLINNLVYSLTQLGRIEEALVWLDKIDIANADDNERATFLATIGLISYKEKDLKKGREYYEKSIDIFKKTKSNRQLAVACYSFGVEEFNFSKEKGTALLKQAFSIADKYKINELLIHKKKYSF